MERLAIALMVGIVLAGCGSLPVAPVVNRPTVDTLTPVTPAASVAPVTRSASVQTRLEQVQAAANATHVWKARTRTEMLNKDATQDYNEATVVWQRPGTMSAEVVAAAISKKVGTKLVFDGKEEVRVKTYLFGFLPLKVTLPVTDARLVDARGRSLKDTSTERLFEALFHPQASVREIGTGTSAGEPVDLLEVVSPLAFKGIVREVFGISRRNGLPILRDSFDAKGQRVFRLQLQQMRTNVPVLPADFSLD